MRDLTTLALATTLLVAVPATVGDTSAAFFYPSTEHHIECRNVRGETFLEFTNDRRGAYYNTTGSVRFLDKATGMMKRVTCGTMIETWDPKDNY